MIYTAILESSKRQRALEIVPNLRIQPGYYVCKVEIDNEEDYLALKLAMNPEDILFDVYDLHSSN